MGRRLVVPATSLLVLLGAGPAAAEPPVQVADQVVDEAGALGEDAAVVRDAVDDLADESGIDLYAVVVSSFESTGDSDWVEETAARSELGAADLLFAVAAGDETYEYGWWVDEEFPLSVVDVEDLLVGDVVPELEDGDWAGAVTVLADGLATLAADAGDRAAQAETVAAEEAATSAEWTARTTAIVLGVLAVVLLAAHALSRRRSPTGSSG